jgi:hypothetical protein
LSCDVEAALKVGFEPFKQKKVRSSLVPQAKARRASMPDLLPPPRLVLDTCERAVSKSAPASPVARALQDQSSVTVHFSEPPLGENKVPEVSFAKALLQNSISDDLAFKYASNSKLHHNFELLNHDKDHRPWVKINGKYPIQVALSNLTTTSLATSALYDYMMHSIKSINKEAESSSLAEKISQQDLNQIVANSKYTTELKQRWEIYVQNLGVPSEEVSR